MYSIIGTVAACLSTLITGLVAWGFKNQVAVLEQKIETVRQEFHAELEKAGNAFYARVNGNYVRTGALNDLKERVDRIENRVDDLE